MSYRVIVYQFLSTQCSAETEGRQWQRGMGFFQPRVALLKEWLKNRKAELVRRN